MDFRHTILALVACLALPLSGALAAQPTPTPVAGPAKVVIALRTGDLARFESRVLKLLPRMRADYAAQGRRLDAVVVVHGDAYRFFLKSLDATLYADDTAARAAAPRLKAALAALSKSGVRFELCLGGMKKRALDPTNRYAFTHTVPNAFMALIDWQNRGYARLVFD